MEEGFPVVWMPGGVRTEIQLGSEQTGGAFCLGIDHPPPGWALPRHRHASEAETIHVVEGEFEMELDGRAARFGPGETLHIPKGIAHSARNVGDSTGRRVIIFTPGGMERFFLELGSPSPDRLAPLDTALACAKRFGWQFSS